MSDSLSRDELVQLVRRVFRPRDDDRRLAVLIDLPDDRVPDHPHWKARREMSTRWCELLTEARTELGLDEVALVRYCNAGRNNADLPDRASLGAIGAEGRETTFAEIFDTHRILLAATEFSATAPLKLKAREHGFREDEFEVARRVVAAGLAFLAFTREHTITERYVRTEDLRAGDKTLLVQRLDLAPGRFSGRRETDSGRRTHAQNRLVIRPSYRPHHARIGKLNQRYCFVDSLTIRTQPDEYDLLQEKRLERTLRNRPGDPDSGGT